MPRDFNRADRVADAIQRELAELLRSEIRDPRLEMVNITAVEVSRDMSAARVYVNFIIAKDEREKDEAIDALNKAAGFLRTRLARLIRLRVVPGLRFFYDGSGERGRRLSALIDDAVSQDRARHQDGGE